MSNITKKVSWLIIFSLAITLVTFPLVKADATMNLDLDIQQRLKGTVILFLGSSKTYVDNKETKIDINNDQITPVSENNKTLVPVKFISESLGAQVGWDGKTSTVSITLKDKNVKLVLNSQKMTVNEQEVTLDMPAKSINGRTFIPLRALVEALGKKVFYKNGLIIISDMENIFNDSDSDESDVQEIIKLFDEPVSDKGQDNAISTLKNMNGNTMENIANNCQVAQYGGWIYYISHDKFSFNIYKMKLDGSSKTRVEPGTCYYINIIDDWIYYEGSDKSNVYKIKIDGTGKTKLNDDKCDNVNAIGDWIYYSNWSDDHKMYKIKTDGTGRTKLNDDSSWNVVVDGEWIYYNNYENNGKSLYKIKTDGTQRTKICDDDVDNIHIMGDWIYYNARGIFKIKTDGTQKTKISDVKAYEIAVKDEWIYYTKMGEGFANGGPVCKMKLDGTGEVVLNRDSSRFAGMTDQWIFYSVMYRYALAGGGWSYYSELNKMKLDGTEAEKVGQ